LFCAGNDYGRASFRLNEHALMLTCDLPFLF
jgi:hypothetical protein